VAAAKTAVVSRARAAVVKASEDGFKQELSWRAGMA
jgi:hypothetical protein